MERAAYLAVSGPSRAPTEILPSSTALADGVDDPFALNVVFHLRESGHDREQHRSHRRGGGHVPTAKIQDPKASTDSAELRPDTDELFMVVSGRLNKQTRDHDVVLRASDVAQCRNTLSIT